MSFRHTFPALGLGLGLLVSGCPQQPQTAAEGSRAAAGSGSQATTRSTERVAVQAGQPSLRAQRTAARASPRDVPGTSLPAPPYPTPQADP